MDQKLIFSISTDQGKKTPIQRSSSSGLKQPSCRPAADTLPGHMKAVGIKATKSRMENRPEVQTGSAGSNQSVTSMENEKHIPGIHLGCCKAHQTQKGSERPLQPRKAPRSTDALTDYTFSPAARAQDAASCHAAKARRSAHVIPRCGKVRGNRRRSCGRIINGRLCLRACWQLPEVRVRPRLFGLFSF